jgi:hypothetical protein
MRQKISAIVFAVVLATCAFAQGGEKAAGLPTVDQVLDKYVQALGGKANIEKQTSRVSKGTFEIAAFGATGTAEVFEKAPNKSAAVIDVPGFGTIKEGFDGKVAWASEPQTGLREKTGAELASTKLDSDFYRPLKLKQLYPKITVKGKEKVGDRETYVLEATPADSSVELWYFDAENGLLLRQDAERESPQGKTPVQIYFSSYKDIDGVKFPMGFRQVTSAFTLDVKFAEIKANVPVDDAKFVKPTS